MTGNAGQTLASSQDDEGGDLVDFAANDRLAMAELPPPAIRRLGLLLPVVVASLAVHLALFVVFVLISSEPQPIAEQQETPVEVVEAPPRPPEAKKEAKAAPAPEDKPVEPEKPPEQEHPREAETTPAAPTQEAKTDRTKPEKPAQIAKAEPESSTSKPDEAADAATLKSLQDELASLKAQAADLRAQGTLHPGPDKALGLLPDSFAAVAAPNLSADGDDPVTYQQAIYGLIAKAKKSGRVFVPGVAHVVFNVGSNGELLDVILDHPSGNTIVDDEAIAIVRRAAPFPPPPPGAPRSFPAYMSFVADP